MRAGQRPARFYLLKGLLETASIYFACHAEERFPACPGGLSRATKHLLACVETLHSLENARSG